MSMKIDRIKDDKIRWSDMYMDQNTEQYHALEDEVNYAVSWQVTTSSSIHAKREWQKASFSRMIINANGFL